MKKGKVLGLLAISAVLLTGCVDHMPELSAEQSDIIAEYAAGLLLKYSSNYNYKIASEEEVAAAMAARQETAENAEVNETQSGAAETEDAESQSTASSGTQLPEPETEVTQVQVVTDLDFAAELDIDDLIIRYQSFEICSSYPQDNTGFSVSAAQGRKLLVIHFDLEGLPEEDIDCNLFDYDIKMHVNINGASSVPALSTMLPNDIASYMDVVQAGEIVDVVAVMEISDMTEEEIQTLTLSASADGKSCTAQLK